MEPVSGQVKEKWGNLTDDDLQIQGGNVDQVVGKIQQKTGETREAIEEFLNNLTSRSASAFLRRLRRPASMRSERAIRSRQVSACRRPCRRGLRASRSRVQQNPTQAVAVVLRSRPGARRTGGALP